MKHVLKDGPAKHVIEGFSGSGSNYAQVIKCLHKRYNRPRLIQRMHVCAILKTPPVKDGNSKDLRRLYDVANQHLCTLKAMDYKSYESFITSVLELELDEETTFERQRHSQDVKKVPNYQDIFISWSQGHRCLKV